MSDSSSPQAAQPASAGTTHADMQAVVVIHGMGEQRPMDTIKAFVKEVWETDEVITANKLPHPTQVWSKPDVRTGSLASCAASPRAKAFRAHRFPMACEPIFTSSTGPI
jgi:hypothetical protein